MDCSPEKYMGQLESFCLVINLTKCHTILCLIMSCGYTFSHGCIFYLFLFFIEQLADLWVDESFSLIRINSVTWRDHSLLYRCTVDNRVGTADNSVALVVRRKHYYMILVLYYYALSVGKI